MLPVFPGCGHCPLVFKYFFQLPVNVEEGCGRRRAWYRANYASIENVLSDIDWNYEFSELSLDDMVSRFESVLSPLIELYVPLYCTVTSQPKFKPPQGLTDERKAAWSNYKVVRRQHGRQSQHAVAALQVFQEVNFRFRNFYNVPKISYERSLIADVGCKSKMFHRYIRSKKVGSPTVGPLSVAGGLTSNCSQMAEIFACSYSSVYNDHHLIEPIHYEGARAFTVGTIADVPISVDDVKRVLSALDVESSMGPDGLHPCLLKSYPSLATALFLIFKHSLNMGKLPRRWKLSEIIPLFKKGSRSDPLNYRPISLTSICCKSLERIITSVLMNYLDVNNLLSGDQFGFRKGRAVDDQMLLVYDNVTSWLDSGYVIDVVFFLF